MKELDKIMGAILLAERDEAMNIYNSVDDRWLLTDFHKAIYQVMGRLFGSGDVPDLVNVSTSIRDLKGYNKDWLLGVSELTSGVTHLDLIHIGSLLGKCDEAFTERRASILTSNLTQTITNGVFSIEKYRKLLEKGIDEISFKKVERRSNVDILFEVAERHNLAKKGELGGVELPYSTFDKVVLIEDVDLVVIGARPAMGKTAFVVSTATKMALAGQRVLVFALEMSEAQMMRRVAAHITAIDSNKIKYGECNNYEMSKLMQVAELDSLNNLTIVEGSQRMNDIARIVAAEKPDVVFVDYLQKIKPERASEDLYTSVTKASNGLKELAQQLHTPVIAMAQLSRPPEHKVGKRPSLPDLRQSGEIEQDASIVGFLHRPEYYGDELMEDGTLSAGMCEVIIAKNREGSVGIYPMRVSLKISKFMEGQSYFPEQSGGTGDSPF